MCPKSALFLSAPPPPARALAPGEQYRTMAGTPEFVAPEVVNYEFISSQTDMWAVGVRQPGHLNTSSLHLVK